MRIPACYAYRIAFLLAMLLLCLIEGYANQFARCVEQFSCVSAAADPHNTAVDRAASA